jgi:hypothetical protein
MQPQPRVVTRGQYRVHVRGQVRQQPGELSERFWRGQLVEIIIEVGCRCGRFRAAGRDGSVLDRVEQGKPELLGILLVALHPQHGEPARLR